MRTEPLITAGLATNAIEHWLREDDPVRLAELWQAADEMRRVHVGDAVHLRGLIEISNRCCRMCKYCGLRAANQEVERYRMSHAEIIACAQEARQYDYGTVVLQAGEDPEMSAEWVADVVRAIKHETGLAVTLSLGERDVDELQVWREAGADRYLVRIETSDPALYAAIHPGRHGQPSHPEDRIGLLRALKGLGYEAGSGVMLGIPGQTYASLARDIALFRELDLDMIGVGPFIPHPATPLGYGEVPMAAAGEQVLNSELMTYKVIALTRLACPEANIPSTTALATLNLETGRELGLERGANIVMPNLTPPEYRINYEIYPAKACIRETAQACHTCMQLRILSIGREPGHGPGGRQRQVVPG